MTAVTVLIVARNAASTIERALRSVAAEPADRIVVVDDASEDATVERASATGDPRLDIVTLPQHRTVGHARQMALASVTTPVGVWLDADDEVLPGRVARLLEALEAERADFAADAAELVGPAAGAPRHLPMPAFLGRPPGVARLFERNYLPAPGALGFRTAAARQVGYDASLHGAEDIDLLLRAIAAGHRVALVGVPGYRVHASPGTLSRDDVNQRAMYRTALAKHAEREIERLWRRHGGGERLLAWALVSIAIFRQDLGTGWRALDRAVAAIGDPAEVLEPDGPCRRPEGWRADFFRGTLAALGGRLDLASRSFEGAEQRCATAEGCNNLGVVLARLGSVRAARACFDEALARRPGYADATRNLQDPKAGALTTHPLREAPARDDYHYFVALRPAGKTLAGATFAHPNAQARWGPRGQPPDAMSRGADPVDPLERTGGGRFA